MEKDAVFFLEKIIFEAGPKPGLFKEVGRKPGLGPASKVLSGGEGWMGPGWGVVGGSGGVFRRRMGR